MSAVQKILNSVDRPRQTSPGRWAAGCPICQSRRGRPVSIRETDDGRVLIHGFCGHGAGEIVSALGLQLSDLFPEGSRCESGPIPNRISAREVLSAVAIEIDTAAILLADLLEGRQLSEDAWQRLALAAERVGRAAAYVR